MFEAQYAKEPFDLRLTVLRLIRNLHIILLVTVVGTVIFGGGYYVKNILLVKEHTYEATAVYKVEYTEEPSKSGDYYINEMSWNTYVQSEDFVNEVMRVLSAQGADWEKLNAEDVLSATLASDLHIPSVTVTTDDPEDTIRIERAVETVMTGYFADTNPQIKEISVIDSQTQAVETERDVRPVRAAVLSAVLSCFFAIVIFLLYEIGNDGIWLPATIRKRYGLKCVGTLEAAEISANMEHIFEGMKKTAVCGVTSDIDTEMLIEKLKEMHIVKSAAKSENDSLERKLKQEWIAIQSSMPDAAFKLRSADSVLLAVNAGTHSGKKLERAMEFMAEQDIEITAVLLCNADEWIIKRYYFIRK
jgi:capsular polysaccharide biosynthesis protein